MRACDAEHLHTFFSNSYADHRDLHSFPTRRLPICLAEAPAYVRRQAGRLHPQLGVVPLELRRSDEHTSELSHMSISYAVFCLKKNNVFNDASRLTRRNRLATFMHRCCSARWSRVIC